MHRVLSQPERGARCVLLEATSPDAAAERATFDSVLAAAIYALPNLLRLELSGWTRLGITHIFRALKTCRRLRTLSLDPEAKVDVEDAFDQADFASLLVALPALNSLELSCNFFGEPVWPVPLPVDEPIKIRSRTIAHLRLDGVVLTDPMMAALEDICAPLRSVALARCEISVAALDRMLRINGPTLLRVSLRGHETPGGTLGRAARWLVNAQSLGFDSWSAGPAFWSTQLKRLRHLHVHWVDADELVQLVVGIYEMWPRLASIGVEWTEDSEPHLDGLQARV